MVDKTIPTKDERTVVDVYDTTRDNLIRTVDELQGPATVFTVNF